MINYNIYASHDRAWKYDAAVKEYFVETSTKQTIRQSELLKRQETHEAGEAL